MEDRLPSFQRPPVVETVLGIQFPRVKGLSNAHLGAFWKSLGSGWPHTEDAAPLEPEFETFGGEPAWSRGMMFRLSSAPPEGRLWIRNESRDRLIQVQNGRLHYNWVAQSGSDYPRYHRVRPEFIETLRAFRAFLHEELDQAVIANQWEVTYVNRLPRGTVWSTPEDWVRLFPGQAGIPTTLPTLALESFGSSWHYEIPPRQGRLHVEIQHRLQDGGDPVLIMKLTARGHASGPGESGISAEEGLELGHEAIVRTFFAMTSPEAHNYWGMCQ